jgi:hypothetical protein
VAENDRTPVSGVDTAEVPSAAWGWSGEAPRTFRAAGWIFSIFLLSMFIGNHTGRIEDAYLAGFALVIIFALVLDIIRRRRPH